MQNKPREAGMKYVIIGNGVSGMMAAETIRRLDVSGEIVIISDETGVPYCRPMISMVLEGAIPPDRLPIRKQSFYEDMKIEPVLGRRVSNIDVEQKTVQIGNGARIAYDKLLIASGAAPRPIKAGGTELKNIFYMRTESDVLGMTEVLPTVKHALVLGGGLVGFKAAYGLLHRGIPVTMLIRSGYPLSMQVDPAAGEIVYDRLKKHGLTVKLGAEVTAFNGNGVVKSARLSDGSDIPCDMAVIGKGVLPSLSFIPRDKIEVDLGILVNRNLETSVPDIYACGDVAEFFDIARKTRWVNAIWPEAVTQGRIAGMNMAGKPVAYHGSLSRNVIRIFDTDVMTAGIVNPGDDATYDILITEDRRRNIYRKFVFNGDRLAGMVLVNGIENGGVLVSAIHNEIPIRIPKERFLDPFFNFRMLAL